MEFKKYWFSLIEIIIAIFVITVWVLWIYKLINSNMLLLSNSQENLELQSLVQPFRECVEVLFERNRDDFNSTNAPIGYDFSVDFWDDLLWCNKSNYNPEYSFSWVTIDNTTYYMYAKVTLNNDEKIKMALNIFSDKGNYLYWSWSNSENKYLLIYK